MWNPAPGLATLPYRYSQIAAYFFDRLGISAWGNALTEEHPNAVTEEEVLAWTLDELVALDVPRKILLLQYGGGLSRPVIQEERRELLAAADERGLPVVDTYEPLAAGEAAMLWRGHHTALGNQVVCRQLANALTR